MCGWTWLFYRSHYLQVFKKVVPTLFLSTIPAYCCVWAMIGGGGGHQNKKMVAY
ncbi:hypothetical protein ACHAXR_009241 [Thalassiosira sp. AJA248-18]